MARQPIKKTTPPAADGETVSDSDIAAAAAVAAAQEDEDSSSENETSGDVVSESAPDGDASEASVDKESGEVIGPYTERMFELKKTVCFKGKTYEAGDGIELDSEAQASYYEANGFI